jgi:hypothetical protein
MIDLNPCPICGEKPFTHVSSVSAVGCDFVAYIVECDADNDGTQNPPFIEHNVSVYGKDEKEAKERWNAMGTKEQDKCAKK